MTDAETTPPQVDSTVQDPKKYSALWSLLTMGVLLAAWLAIPKLEVPEARADLVDRLPYFFYLAGYWSLVVGMFWVLAGRRALATARSFEGHVVASPSIWTILVFTGLLALWIVIPRQVYFMTGHPLHGYFFFWHQLAIWAWSGALLWLYTGRRRWVLVAVIATIVIIWLPMFLMLMERWLTRGHIIERLLSSVGIEWIYFTMYDFFHQSFGYAPSGR